MMGGERLTKEELGQVNILNKEIEMWQRELDKIKNKSPIKCQIITDMPRGGGDGDKTADAAIEIATIENIISGKLADIQFQRKKIIEYICSVEDSLLRQILTYKHINGLTWEEIAFNLGYENSTVRKKYYEWFNENIEA